MNNDNTFRPIEELIMLGTKPGVYRYETLRREKREIKIGGKKNEKK
jgi:hypothetical protein